jgi:uncharacterized protein (TIGR00269 family)
LDYCQCGENGEYQDPYNPYSNIYCATCFSNYLEKKFLKGMSRKIRGQSVAIAVSGGKDSMALLHILALNQEKLRIPALTVIMMEEGIFTIQEERIEILKFIKRNYPSVSISYVKYKELVGYSIPELIESSDRKKTRYTPCMICGILRRQALFQIGFQNNVQYLALGTTLEDETATVLINIIRGSPSRNSSVGERYRKFLVYGFPARIKPFSRISEDLIKKFVEINKIPTLKSHCPYADRSLRLIVSKFVSTLKMKDPRGSLLFNVRKQKYHSETRMQQEIQFIRCQICNFPTNQSHCPSCKILMKITSK